MAKKTDMNALIRAGFGVTIDEDEDEEKVAADMNASIRAAFGVRVETEGDDDA